MMKLKATCALLGMIALGATGTAHAGTVDEQEFRSKVVGKNWKVKLIRAPARSNFPNPAK